MDAAICLIGKEKARIENCSFSGLVERLVNDYNPRTPTVNNPNRFVRRKRGRPRKLKLDDVSPEILGIQRYAEVLGLPTPPEEEIEIPVAPDTGFDEPEPLYFGD